MSQGLWEKQRLIIGLEQEEDRMGLEHLLVPENRTFQRKSPCQKDTGR